MAAASPRTPPCRRAQRPPRPPHRPGCSDASERELLQFNVRLAKNRQALLDAQRIERKAFREHARIENAAAAYARELGALLDERGFTQELLLSEPEGPGEAVLIVQLSDLHFNERVELPSNRYDFTVAAARLVKLAGRIKQLGRSYGATKVVIACLGDFLNSDRRLDELLSNATNRSKATLLAVDILRAFLLDLRSEFSLEIYGITGNESRVRPELGWSDELATDSYDLMIYSILKRGFRSADGIAFCGFRANELLFEVMGRTFLCLHGLSSRSSVALLAGASPSEDTVATTATAITEPPACGDGLEPAPGTPEALALLAEKGIAPRAAAGEPLGPDDGRFSPIAVGHLTHRLVEVKRMLEQLGAEQKELHETLRLAHLRGDLLHLLPPDQEPGNYQLPEGPTLHRRQGRKQWHYTQTAAELEAQLKARQLYEQAAGLATEVLG